MRSRCPAPTSSSSRSARRRGCAPPTTSSPARCERAGASVAVAAAARAARGAHARADRPRLGAGARARPPRAGSPSTTRARSSTATTTAALLWPRPGAIRFDAPAAGNRPGPPRRLAAPARAPAPARRRRCSCPRRRARSTRPARRRRPPSSCRSRSSRRGRRPASATSRRSPTPPTRTRRAWTASWRRGRRARRDGEELVVAGTDARARGRPACASPGVLAPEEYRALLRRARVYVTAPRREDYGIAQLEALADGCRARHDARRPGPTRRCRSRARSTRGSSATTSAGALRTALDDPAPGYAARALAAARRPTAARRSTRRSRDELLPRAAAADAGRARLRSAANSSHGRVLATSAAVEPRAARGRDAPAGVARRRVGAVGVGVDEDPHAGRARRRARGRR